METQHLHRGRLIDHLQLVVRDLDASHRFYEAVLGTLGVPMGAGATTGSGRMNCSCPVPTARRRRAC